MLRETLGSAGNQKLRTKHFRKPSEMGTMEPPAQIQRLKGQVCVVTSVTLNNLSVYMLRTQGSH